MTLFLLDVKRRVRRAIHRKDTETRRKRRENNRELDWSAAL
jgi:hypothetical protein